MDVAQLWDQLALFIRELPRSGLLLATFVSLLVGFAGTLALRRNLAFGPVMRSVGTMALAGILVLVVLQLSRADPRLEMAVRELAPPGQVVEGGVTRVQLARDGHFWLQGTLNGYPAQFMVDTGATLTAVSAETARAAGLKPSAGSVPVQMQTANGPIIADIARIDELQLGNISAHGLDAVIAPSLGGTNVVGMNLLSRLASWRVEGNTLILMPALEHPQAD